MNILIFPCGSEVGIEIFRSLKNYKLILHGANSIKDSGRTFYEKNHYLPNLKDSNFIYEINKLIKKENIKFIYPSNDAAIYYFANNTINCEIIGSPPETCRLLRYKSKTYNALKNIVSVPKIWSEIPKNKKVFIKPDVGQGGERCRVYTKGQKILEDEIIVDYLPNEEYTVDCFTNRNKELIYVGARLRNRIRGGLSAGTKIIKKNHEFVSFAKKINNCINLRGSWFFQVKRNKQKKLVLLEVSPRIAGSSAIQRFMGVNLSLLSYYDAIGLDLKIIKQNYEIELERNWELRSLSNLSFLNVYVDFDDCIFIKNKLNACLLHFLIQCLNENKKIYLISKHKGNIKEKLKKLKIYQFFNKIYHINKNQKKSNFIFNKDSIFIDDSFSEREEVYNSLKIPVLSPDCIEGFLK